MKSITSTLLSLTMVASVSTGTLQAASNHDYCGDLKQIAKVGHLTESGQLVIPRLIATAHSLRNTVVLRLQSVSKPVVSLRYIGECKNNQLDLRLETFNPRDPDVPRIERLRGEVGPVHLSLTGWTQAGVVHWLGIYPVFSS